ncbi:hypothetical protein HK405_001066 [Cladochytrium tenue]|nr:hypothetical protein HK405_001066 [Cladochytrium tenue]
MDVAPGARVEVVSNGVLTAGTVRFVGPTSFATGTWVGIELDLSNGKNDGSVQGTRYFTCEPSFGVFLRASQIKNILAAASATATVASPTIARPESDTISNRSSSPPAPVRGTAPATARTSSGGPKPPTSTTKTGAPARTPVIAPRSPTLSRGSISGPSSKRVPSANAAQSSPTITRGVPSKTKVSATATNRRLSTAQQSPALAALASPSPLRASDSQPPSPDEAKQDDGEGENEEDAENENADVEQTADDVNAFDEMAANETSNRTVSLTVDTKSWQSATAKAVPNAYRPVANAEVQVTPEELGVSGDEHQVEELLRELEDLRTKQRLADSRRKGDRDKEMELEKLKQELDAMGISKSALMGKLADVQAELKESVRQMQFAQEEQHKAEMQLQEALESMELLTLDKEVAEERADTLRAEVDILQEKVEELTIELEVIKEEGVAMGSDGGEVASGFSSADKLQLERQNERLKEALIRLREISVSQEAELKNKISGLERDLMDFTDQSSAKEALEQKLQFAESRIEELKATKIEELKVTVDDLEALNELNLELEENHVLAERELQAEIGTHSQLEASVNEIKTSYIGSFNDAKEAVRTFKVAQRPGTALASFMDDLQSKTKELQEKLEGNDFIEKVVMKPPPWIERAQGLKAEFLINTDMQKQIETLNDEILTLATEVNQKRQIHQEFSIKIDLLEKKLAGSRGQADKISNLELRVQRLMEKEREFAEAAEHLQEENRKLEQEVAQYKRLARRQEKYGSPLPAKRSLQSFEPPAKLDNIFSEVSTSVASQIPRGPTSELQENLELMMEGNVAAQFEALRAALRYVRAENAQLKSQKLLDASRALFAPSDPLMKKHYGSLKGESEQFFTVPSQVPGISHAAMADLLRDSKLLLRDIQDCGVNMKVVDLGKRPQGKLWSSVQTDPLFQHKSQLDAVGQLAKRGQNITERVKSFSLKVDDGDARKAKSQSRVPLLGKIHVPVMQHAAVAAAATAGTVGGARGSRVGMVLTSREEWKKIHAVFVS